MTPDRYSCGLPKIFELGCLCSRSLPANPAGQLGRDAEIWQAERRERAAVMPRRAGFGIERVTRLDEARAGHLHLAEVGIETSAIRGGRARRVHSRMLRQFAVGNGQVGGDAVV